MTKHIGHQIRDIRQRQRLTLEKMSSRTGLSKSYLSKLERGLTEAGVSNLKKIASQLGLSLVELMGNDNLTHSTLGYMPQGEYSNNPKFISDIQVVKPGQRKTFTLAFSELVYELLTPDLGRKLEVILIKAQPGDNTGKEPIVDPYGEKFVYVIKGRMEMLLDNRPYVLDPGYSISYPANIPQLFRCAGDQPLEAILVIHPPWF